MPFKAIPEKGFIGRDRELDQLKRLADLKEPVILPHLNKDFDPSMITSFLQAAIKELSV